MYTFFQFYSIIIEYLNSGVNMVTRTKLFKALLLHVDSTRENLKGVYLKVSDDGETFSLCSTDGTTGLLTKNLDTEITYKFICETILNEYGLILPEKITTGTMYIGKKFKVAKFEPEDDQNLSFPDIENHLIKGVAKNPLENFPAFGFKQLERANKTFRLLLDKKDVREAYIPHRWNGELSVTEYDINYDILLFVMPVRKVFK